MRIGVVSVGALEAACPAGASILDVPLNKRLKVIGAAAPSPRRMMASPPPRPVA